MEGVSENARVHPCILDTTNFSEMAWPPLFKLTVELEKLDNVVFKDIVKTWIPVPHITFTQVPGVTYVRDPDKGYLYRNRGSDREVVASKVTRIGTMTVEMTLGELEGDHTPPKHSYS